MVRASRISRKRQEVSAPSAGFSRVHQTRPAVDAMRRRDLVVRFDVGRAIHVFLRLTFFVCYLTKYKLLLRQKELASAFL